MTMTLFLVTVALCVSGVVAAIVHLVDELEMWMLADRANVISGFGAVWSKDAGPRNVGDNPLTHIPPEADALLSGRATGPNSGNTATLGSNESFA